MTLIVRAEGLTKRYGRVRALDSLDLQVEEGSLFGLLGPNGAGKTTAFGILCGWLKADSGSASILGVASHLLHTLGGKVAALPQDATFPPQIAIRDELAHLAVLQGMSGSKARREADRVLDAVGLAERKKAKTRELSHGMKTRLSIAQTLIGGPAVIFLDEPTGGLDPKNARQIRDLIASLVPRTTVILSSHNLAEVQELCTHAAILDHGQLRFSGPVEELTRTRGEVIFELAPGPLPPLDEIQSRLDVVARLKAGLLEVRYSEERKAVNIIRGVIEIMYRHQVGILGVRRGVPLEGAFLALVGQDVGVLCVFGRELLNEDIRGRGALRHHPLSGYSDRGAVFA